MLTDIWYKDALLIKRRTFEMFGHGFIIVSSQVVANVDESSQSPFLLVFFVGFCFFTKKKH